MPVIPSNSMRSTIDVNDVRNFIFDRTVEDNPMELDLTFTDQEIQNAMRYAAMSYNETTPYVDVVDPVFLPFGFMFLNGAAAYLYLAKLQSESRQDIEYMSGNMTVDIYKRKIEHLQNFVKLFKADFERMAKERKLSINIHNAFMAY